MAARVRRPGRRLGDGWQRRRRVAGDGAQGAGSHPIALPAPRRMSAAPRTAGCGTSRPASGGRAAGAACGTPRSSWQHRAAVAGDQGVRRCGNASGRANAHLAAARQRFSGAPETPAGLALPAQCSAAAPGPADRCAARPLAPWPASSTGPPAAAPEVRGSDGRPLARTLLPRRASQRPRACRAPSRLAFRAACWALLFRERVWKSWDGRAGPGAQQKPGTAATASTAAAAAAAAQQLVAAPHSAQA